MKDRGGERGCVVGGSISGFEICDGRERLTWGRRSVAVEVGEETESAVAKSRGVGVVRRLLRMLDRAVWRKSRMTASRVSIIIPRYPNRRVWPPQLYLRLRSWKI